MAIFALHRRVRSEQREAVLVILDLLHRGLPTLNGVTLRAIRAHPSLVHVGMTVLAILPHIGKDGLGMALRALNFFVHTPQRIASFVVIELGNGFDGPPRRRGMAVFARDRERTVRTTGRAALRLGKASAAYWPAKDQRPEHEFETLRRFDPPRTPSVEGRVPTEASVSPSLHVMDL